ncbi:MAG: hypothetical protein R3C28_10230 [Pirellulaceae bacterium]
MQVRTIRICSPSRLHFGLLSFGHVGKPQFGGVGIMLNQPGLEVEFSLTAESESKSIGLGEILPSGPLAERIQLHATSWFLNRHGGTRISPGRITANVIRSPRLHNGLGTGTQVALAVATGMEILYCGEEWETVQQRPGSLAKSVDRLGRSSIGTWGFVEGGLIWDGGRISPDALGKLNKRTTVPDEWRAVLILSSGEGLSGEKEKSALASLPPIPETTTQRLTDLIEQQIFPAAESDNIAQFGEAVFEYGCLAGECFASSQGGCFASPQLASWVKAIRDRGYHGVGQSSWGPALFTFVPDEPTAQEMCRWFAKDVDSSVDLIVAQPNHHGALVQEISIS